MGRRDASVSIIAIDERTFRIEAPGGRWVWGGLGPDSLALGRVSIGPIFGWQEEEPGVVYMICNSEAGVYVFDVPHTSDVAPFDAVYEAPHTCLEEEAPAARSSCTAFGWGSLSAWPTPPSTWDWTRGCVPRLCGIGPLAGESACGRSPKGT